MHRTLIIGAVGLSLSASASAYEPGQSPATGGILDVPLVNPNVISPVAPVSQVEALAESGERAAQVVLGIEYAREAQSLIGIPAAANQAAEDAARWYSQAARRGFPGAPSLDYAGVSFYPIRVQRSRN